MNLGADRKTFVVRVSPGRKPTCNILIPGWSAQLSGGPLSILEIARKLTEHGIRVRFLNVMNSVHESSDILPRLPLYFREHMEWVDHKHINDIFYSVSDVFMATLYFTAFFAQTMQKCLNDKPILYMIQDCEPFFFPQNSESAYAYSTYDIPHIPIFNSWILENYFQENRLSVFRGGSIELRSFTFFPTYHSTADRNKMKKEKKRLIVYSRPSIERNAYDFAISCVWEAVRQGLFPPEEWIIVGVGCAPGTPNVSNLGNRGVVMYNMDHMDDEKYKEFITTGDMGLSLMLTPHPSLPPFDFAAAGMLVVTNLLFQRTETMYHSVSHNFFPATLSIPSVVDNLRRALTKVDDYDFRIAGSFLNLPPHVVDYEFLHSLVYT